MKLIFKQALFFYCLVVSIAQAEIQVIDDVGQKIVLQQAAKRIVSLAPHTTELLFEAGADQQIVGTVSFSDFPEQAKNIQRIGSYNKFDLEAIVALNPDLIVAWESGNTLVRIDEVKALGFPVFINEPREFKDIPKSLMKLGKLLGTEMIANKNAADFNRVLSQLKQNNKQKPPVKIFYQVWNEPLFTVNGEHLISKVIELCGGNNVFKDVSVLSPQVGLESVLQKNPDVIVAGMNKERAHWLEEWKKWPGLNAVKYQHLYAIDADLIVRHTPRILLGTQKMCDILDRVRSQNQ
jgi:iron complex transport system substrate-binding protein